jgi:hypothetical protein
MLMQINRITDVSQNSLHLNCLHFFEYRFFEIYNHGLFSDYCFSITGRQKKEAPVRVLL